jgi:hypothetical protein
MKLRVFYSLHVLKEKHYTVTQHHFDFPSDVTPEAAYAELYSKHGRVESSMWDQELGTNIASPKYAEIHHHSMVDADREPVMLPSEKMIEQALPGIDFKACLKDSPNMKHKRRKSR